MAFKLICDTNKNVLVNCLSPSNITFEIIPLGFANSGSETILHSDSLHNPMLPSLRREYDSNLPRILS